MQLVKISDARLPAEGRFGEKGLRLQQMKAKGFEVPDGLLLSVEFLDHVVESMGLKPAIDAIVERDNRGESNLQSHVLALFQDKLPDTTIRSAVEAELRLLTRTGAETGEAAAEGATSESEKTVNRHVHCPSKMKIPSLSGQRLGETLFAVRSAALGEDDRQTSFAGQYTTFLNVPCENLWSAIFQCYASWWTDRAVSYRRRNGIKSSAPLISLIVQQQIQPDYAGVLFTRHPFKPSEAMVIEAVAGVGEKLVSGTVTPARWEMDPHSKAILTFQPDPDRLASGLHRHHLDALVEIGKKAEKAYGKGLDLEWAIQEGKLYLLQLRPVTTSTSAPPSPSHPAENVYSRCIVEDLWSDRMTDITASIVFDALSDLYTFKTPLRTLKLDDLAALQAIRVIDGYGYLNALVIARLLELLPGFLRFREIQHVFPPAIREKVLQTPFQLRKVLKLVPRLPLLISDAAILPFLTVPLLRRHLRRMETALNQVDIHSYGSLTSTGCRKELQRLLDLLSSLQVRNQWGYGNASIFTWLLNHFAIHFAGKSDAWVLGQLRHIPNNVTLRAQKDLIEICALFDPSLMECFFSTHNNIERWGALQSLHKNHPAVRLLDRFIQRYRYRSANRDFVHPRWDEKPELVLDLLAVLLKTREDSRKTGAKRLMEDRRSNPLRHFLAAPVLAVLVPAAKAFLALREDLRFALDKVFYRIRRLLLAMAETEAFESLHALENGIFFLRLEELSAILEGKMGAEEMLPTIQMRKQDYFKAREASPPFYVLFDGTSLVDLTPAAREGKVYTGTAASPGMAEGKARIIRGESDFGKLQKGEILIAYNTDPGWTPLFITTAGVAVEMGGILNHCAIVAREYGVPAVVGLQGITGKIKDGDRVRLNGNAGTLEMID